MQSSEQFIIYVPGGMSINVELWDSSGCGGLDVECSGLGYKDGWIFKTKTTTRKFLAGYDTEALVESLFKDCDMPHDKKRYIANAIILACKKFEKLENGDTSNG